MSLRRFAATAFAAVLTVAVPATTQVRLSDHTPKDALAYARIASFADMMNGIEKSPFKQLWDDPEMQDFLQPAVTSMVQQGLDQMKMFIGHDIEELKQILGGAVEFSLLSVERSGWTVTPTFAAGWTATDVDKAKALVDRMLEMGVQSGSVVAESIDVGGTAFRELEIDDTPFKLVVGFVGPTFLVSSSKEMIAGIVGGTALAEDARLASDANYQAAAKQARTDGAHVHFALGAQAIARTVKVMSDATDEDYVKIMKGFGLDTLSFVTGSMRFDERGANEVYHLRTGKRHGYMSLIDVAKPGITMHKAVEGDSVAYMGIKANLLEAYDRFKGYIPLFGEVFGEREAAEIAQAMEESNSGEWGFKLRDDLLANIGDEFALNCRLPSGGGFIPDVLLVGRVTDATKLEALFDQLVEMAPKDDVTIGKQAIKVRGAGAPGADGTATDKSYPLWTILLKDSMVPISPAVSLVGDKLVVGVHIRSVKNYVRKGVRQPLTTAPAFTRGLGSIGWQGTDRAISVMFLDVKKALLFGYDAGTPFLSGLDPEDMGVPLDFAMLPSSDAISKPFDTAMIGHVLDDDGITAYTQGPIPVAVLELLAVGGATMAPRRMRAFDSAEARPVSPAPPMPAPDTGKKADKPGTLGITLDEDNGVCKIRAVREGGAAAAAGLKAGDIVESIDGKGGDIDTIAAALSGKKAGDRVEVRVKRGETKMSFQVTLK